MAKIQRQKLNVIHLKFKQGFNEIARGWRLVSFSLTHQTANVP